MSWVASAILGGSAIGAGASIFGANTAASAQKSAAANATQAQQQMFGVAQQNEQPFINAGSNAAGLLTKLLTPGADISSLLSQIPGFQFANTYGQKAITNQATMSGLSGNALTAGANYATGLANNTYGTVLGGLQGLVNSGAGAAGSLTGGAINTGASIGGNITGAGNAQAGANIGTANAVGGLGSSLSNYTLLNQLTGGKLFGGTGGIYGQQQQPQTFGAPTPQFDDSTGAQSG